jgi:ABC-2 type transport system permease protein
MGHMDVKRLKIYWYYWKRMSIMTFQSLISTRLASVLFLSGKLIRIGFWLVFLLALKDKIQLLAGYNLDQLIVFYLIYNVFDLLGQIFYRGIYWYRNEIISGNFDFTLLKPLNPLFQVLASHTDWLDIPPLILTIIFLIIKLPAVGTTELLTFIFMGIIAMVLVTAIHILVAAIGVMTTEVDHAIWIYRDLSQMARFPVDIYVEGVRFFLNFIIPIGLIFTVPAKALFGVLSSQWIILTVAFAVVFYLMILKFWNYALKQYSSASS